LRTKKKIGGDTHLTVWEVWFECKATALSLCFFLISIHFILKKNCCCQRKTTVLVIWQSLQNQSLTIKSNANVLSFFLFYLDLDWTSKMKRQERHKKSQGSGGQTPTRFQNPTHGVQIKPRAHDTCKWHWESISQISMRPQDKTRWAKPWWDFDFCMQTSLSFADQIHGLLGDWMPFIFCSFLRMLCRLGVVSVKAKIPSIEPQIDPS